MNIDMPNMSDIPALKALWKEAFSDEDEFIDVFFKTAFSPSRAKIMRDNGVPVSVLYWFDSFIGDFKIAYVYAVATALTHRGRGIAGAVLEDLHTHLADSGYDGAILVPARESLFGFYEKFGYSSPTYVSETEVDAGESGIPCRKIGADEYARERRKLLPKGGVIQENEGLAFLSATAKFYTGEGFLLAARREGKELFGMELLGDISLAPKILTSLGIKHGKFRTPMGKRAFSLYFPLHNGAPVPSYFGLAFD